jgi:4'-phosphopantetheinyl transferase
MAVPAADAIHLYLGLLDKVDRPHTYDACLAMLSQDERTRAGRFLLERHRRQFVIAHGLVRTALSRHVPAVSPDAWSFVTNRYGRPFIAGPQTESPLFFSLSHTDGCVACVVSVNECVGVDVEATDRKCAHREIAEFVFSPEEVGALCALPPAELIDRFFDYWTLKEAYIKARGMGLHLPLDQFTMVIGPGGAVGISFAPGFDDTATRWTLTQASPSSRIRLAVADGSGPGRGLPIVHQPWPLP